MHVTQLKGVILIGKSLLYHLVEKPSSYVIPGLRYEGKYKLCSIIGTVHYFLGPFLTVHSNGSLMAVIIPWNLKSEAP